MYVITGATGNIESQIAQRLLQKGKKVRAIARNKNKLNVLAEQGAEIRAGSLEDTEFLTQAFEGATAVYAMIPPNEEAESFISYMDKIGESIVEALGMSKVAYVENLSSIGADLPSGTGPIAGLYKQEQRLNRLDANVLHLRPAFFMENFLINIPMIREMGILGSPAKPDLTIPMVATKDIGSVGASHLESLGFKGKSWVDLLGPRDYSMIETAKILGTAIGKPDLPYVQFSYEDGKNGMIQSGLSPDMADLYVEMYQALNETLIKPVPRTPENTTPTTMEEFAQKVFAPAYKNM